MNAVKALPTGETPRDGRAVVIYGVKVEGPWKYSKFSVQLAEYDLAKQNITGNCFQFNRTEAFVAPEPGELKYFAFEVPAGYYVYSPFHLSRLSGDFLAFEVPSGRSVYIGDFVFEKNGLVSLHREPIAEKNGIETNWPSLKRRISLAKVLAVKPPFIFICTP
ncbi:hypothetical protein [Duganella qianjiadongensis]|uniref:Uncharacterized protein n=1 Tax=Duganella qianjiadongensis TaxID=2692176 RepID=A0ABW9VIJ8_9BURK|nr:hypothetical protein [Duganella qianjiadongensis]MYM39433.1 hypothetical protein [Duganella qianjiadongensis]